MELLVNQLDFGSYIIKKKSGDFTEEEIKMLKEVRLTKEEEHIIWKEIGKVVYGITENEGK